MNEPDQTRFKQLEMLDRVLILAGSLNRGNNIVAKISELETACEKLSLFDFVTPRSSFTQYIRDLVIADCCRSKNDDKTACLSNLAEND